jgi:PEP-CTERM motif
LGVAYDNTRDELYVSFCHVGCASLAAGLVDVVNPVNGTVLSMLFRTDGFATGGLGYDPVTDSLWVGDLTTVRNMSRTGAVLSSFTRPQPAGFVDGLEFIGNTVPEPGALILVATGIGFLAVMVRRRRRSA